MYTLLDVQQYKLGKIETWQNSTRKLVRSVIAFRLYSLRFSNNLRLHILAGSLTSKFSFPLGDRGPHLTQCVMESTD